MKWLIRNFNLLFHRGRCVHMIFKEEHFQYGDVVINVDLTKMKSLGKGWFKILMLLLVSTTACTQELPHINNVDDQIIEHKAYTLSYNERCEQANWVKYLILKEDLDSTFAKRKNNFKSDVMVPTGSAHINDYKGSGYDRGHLAPAANFKESQVEMDESFYMSNISPQEPGMNRGVWKRIEAYERKAAIAKDSVWVITGPILKGITKTIGDNKVCVPDFYYKIIYTKGWYICFLVKNEKSDETLSSFKQSLEVVERESQINFNISD